MTGAPASRPSRPRICAPAIRAGGAATLVLALGLLVAAPGAAQITDRELADEVERTLREDVLRPWYPRVLDRRYGGYVSDLSADWELFGAQEKMIVTQARHVWTLSRAADYTGRERYARWAGSGVRFLDARFWDRTYGGFYWRVDRSGDPVGDRSGGGPIKRAYGEAFALYGLAAYFEVTGDSSALDLAKRGFRWLENHSHDPRYGGYFQFLRRDGRPYVNGYQGTPPKDQNSSIHLLEAFTELYRVWPDPLLRARLREMLVLVRDTMVADRGHLRLFFRRNWEPISYRDSARSVREAHHHLDHVSFGHDIETGYLLLEAGASLGGPSPRTKEVARRLIAHSVRRGWDPDSGGLFDAGYYEPPADTIRIVDHGKAWWAQVEALNSLLLATGLIPEERERYAGLFRRQWRYLDEFLIDRERGGFYAAGLDTEPEAREGARSSVWKGSYHTARALMNVAERLRGEH